MNSEDKENELVDFSSENLLKAYGLILSWVPEVELRRGLDLSSEKALLNIFEACCLCVICCTFTKTIEDEEESRQEYGSEQVRPMGSDFIQPKGSSPFVKYLLTVKMNDLTQRLWHELWNSRDKLPNAKQIDLPITSILKEFDFPEHLLSENTTLSVRFSHR